MSLNNLLLLGDERLLQVSEPIKKNELGKVDAIVDVLHQTLMAFRKTYKAGRAIAAPQVGFFKRIIYLNTGKPTILINPILSHKSQEMMEIWDDCLCFPELLVRVKRHESCDIEFFDRDWKLQKWNLKGSLSELLQHEYDHLDGILATQKAIGKHPLKYRQNPFTRLK